MEYAVAKRAAELHGEGVGRLDAVTWITNEVIEVARGNRSNRLSQIGAIAPNPFYVDFSTKGRGTVSGMAMGATVGAVAGPIGAGIGALLGGLAGRAAGAESERKEAEKQAERIRDTIRPHVSRVVHRVYEQG